MLSYSCFCCFCFCYSCCIIVVIEVSEGIDVNKTSAPKECIISNYCFF